MIWLGNNEVLKTLTITFVDADANADAGGSTIVLPERCSGELKSTFFVASQILGILPNKRSVN